MPKLTSRRVAVDAAPGAEAATEPLHPTTFRFTADERDLLGEICQVRGWTKALAVREAIATLADRVGVPVPPGLQDRRPPALPGLSADTLPESQTRAPAPHRRGRRRANAPGPSPTSGPVVGQPAEEQTSDAAFKARCEEARTAREHRERRAITYDVVAADLSLKLGRSVPRSTAFRWMKGQAQPSISEREVLAQVLGVHPVWLTFGNV